MNKAFLRPEDRATWLERYLIGLLLDMEAGGSIDRTPDTREPSPGGIHGSLALHGTDVIGVLIPDFFVPPRRARERKGSILFSVPHFAPLFRSPCISETGFSSAPAFNISSSQNFSGFGPPCTLEWECSHQFQHSHMFQEVVF